MDEGHSPGSCGTKSFGLTIQGAELKIPILLKTMVNDDTLRGLPWPQAHMGFRRLAGHWSLEKVIANYSVGMIMHGEVVGSMAD